MPDNVRSLPASELTVAVLRAVLKTVAIAVGILVFCACLKVFGSETHREKFHEMWNDSLPRLILLILRAILTWFMLLFIPTVIIAYPFSIITRNAEGWQVIISGIGICGLLLLGWLAPDPLLAVILTAVGGAYGGLYALFFILERKRSLRL